MNDLLVLGLGNQLMADDGIGVIVARRLQRWQMSGVRVMEAGIPGFGLVDMLAAQTRVVFIDAVDAARAPGSVFWVEPESIVRDWSRQSLHQVSLADVLSLLAVAGRAPWMRIIGVQPQQIGAGTKLSGPLRRRLPIITRKTADMVKSVSAISCPLWR